MTTRTYHKFKAANQQFEVWTTKSSFDKFLFILDFRLNPNILLFVLLVMVLMVLSCKDHISPLLFIICVPLPTPPSFSSNSSALDKTTSNKIAIKKVSRAFDDPIDAKRILREIKLMKKFDHENVSY